MHLDLFLSHCSKAGVSGNVKKGQWIAKMGSTGNSTGAHIDIRVEPYVKGKVYPSWVNKKSTTHKEKTKKLLSSICKDKGHRVTQNWGSSSFSYSGSYYHTAWDVVSNSWNIYSAVDGQAYWKYSNGWGWCCVITFDEKQAPKTTSPSSSKKYKYVNCPGSTPMYKNKDLSQFIRYHYNVSYNNQGTGKGKKGNYVKVQGNSGTVYYIFGESYNHLSNTRKY